MRTAVMAIWAVIATVFFVQIANGLQTDILSLRGDFEFHAAAMGSIMAAYYVGYSVAPLLGHRVIERFGHIATIVAASLAAAVVIVLHVYVITPVAWAVLRVVSGFVLATLYVALESWLHGSVDNSERGRVFSVYMVAQMIAMTLAQALLPTGDPRQPGLYWLCGVLLVVAAIPMLVSRDRAPHRPPPEPFGILKLFAVSPMGVSATVLAGVAWAIVFTFGPVYAKGTGFDLHGISLFMGVAMVGAAIVQYPLGWLSDHMGRRATIALMCAGAAVAAGFGWWADTEDALFKLIASGLIGALIFPLYSLTVAHTNDGIAPAARVPAAGGLVLLFGLGSIAGPLISGFVVRGYGASGYFVTLLATMLASLAVVAATR